MGLLKQTLLPPSAHSARKSGVWEDLMDDLSSCVYPAAVDAFEARVGLIEHTLPNGWRELLDDEIEKHRIALQSEDISQILRGYDFS